MALLARGELCVCHLVDILGLPQSTVSHHVGVLGGPGWCATGATNATRAGRTTALDAGGGGRRCRAGWPTLLALSDLSAEAAERPSPPCPMSGRGRGTR